MSIPVVFDGYPAGKTQVTDIFMSLPIATISAFEDQIMKPMVEAEMSGGTKFVTVVVMGHSDRQDDVQNFPTEEAQRASELQASTDRAENARNWLFSEFQTSLQNAGGTIPADWDSATGVAVARFPAGASTLVHPVPVNETQRMQNRRVEFFITRFPRV